MSQLELVCLLPHSQFVLLLHGTARSITVASLKAQGPVNNLTNWLNTHATAATITSSTSSLAPIFRDFT